MRVDLAVVGNLLIDELPDDVVEPGGAALYISLAAASVGATVGLHSVVGEDYPLDILQSAGVKLSLTRLVGAGGRTVIRYQASGRTLSHVGPGHQVMTPQKPHSFQAPLTVLAPMPWEWQLYHLDRCPPGSAFLDPYPTLNEVRLKELMGRVDRLRFLVLNREELEVPLADIPESIPLILKEGADGGYCRLSKRRWEALSTQVIDPTGAGDSFLGAAAAGLALGRDWAECLRLGAVTAASVVRQIGARSFQPPQKKPAGSGAGQLQRDLPKPLSSRQDYGRAHSGNRSQKPGENALPNAKAGRRKEGQQGN